MSGVPDRLANLSQERRLLLQRMLLERAGAAGSTQEIRPRGTDGPAPLSFAQQRLWFMDRLDPGSPAYNIPHALRLRGRLDRGALRRALTAVARRQESLRTVFPEVDGEPVQTVLPPAPVPLPVVDLSGLPDGARDAEAGRRLYAESMLPMELARGPLFRATLLRLGDEEHGLLLTLHHIVSDGWSNGVLVHEVSALYEALTAGRPSPLPPLPVQYADFAVWQRESLSGERLEAQLGWWRERLAGAPPVLDLPTDRPRPPGLAAGADVRAFHLRPQTVRGLRALARDEGATLFMVLLAGWQLLLGRWSGQPDVSVGTSLAGRTRRELEPLIGFFVNTLVLRAEMGGRPTGRELLGRVREMVLGAFAHQEVPFEKLVEELAPERSLQHTPLFQVMFVLHNQERAEVRLGPVDAEPMGRGGEVAKFDLRLTAEEDGDYLGAQITFRTALWDGATVERMCEHLQNLLAALAAAPERPVAELPMLGAAERARVLEEWSATAPGHPAGACVHDLFAAQARRTPDAPALRFRGEALSYAELDRWSARLASHLRGLGVGPETRVGVCLERTPELVVALLGVLRAGGAYVPLDPAYPRARLAHVLEDARAAAVVTTSHLAERLPEGHPPLVLLDADRERIEAAPDAAPESGTHPENLSHVIFTSGSTGRPKGVMIRHSSVVVLLHWLREIVSDAERAATLFSTSVNFDVSVAEVFGTLAWGGTLHLAENALALAEMRDAGIVHASMVPTAAAELLRMDGIPPSVRTLSLGGEALPPELARALYATGTIEKVGNLYGPTEDTTYSTWWRVEPGAERMRVGRPVAGTRAYVLDDELEPVPEGVVGELYLAGDGLARGYAGRPDLTAERFLPASFGPAGSRMYRVTDRVRWLPDGTLEYLGRSDFQVKVRGFRIELGDVEAALREHPGVRDAVAVVREDAASGGPGERRLVAYLLHGEGGAAPSPHALRGWLRERLPEYMVPSAFVALETLPLTGSGKLDRLALPAPEGPAPEQAYVAPAGELEERVAALFAEVLGAERVGAHDDFFDLGGHSLLATRVAARLQKELAMEVPVRVVFESPTVAGVAAWIEAARPGEELEEWEVDEEFARLGELSDEEVMRLLGEG
ncbi:MAG: amino acid adenylation domain-containing protein [Longimicrobiaceae bacterium]